MKCIVIIMALMSSFSLFAKDRPILKCLGDEEKRFHLKKEVGPVYDLNQRLIAEMIQIPGIEIHHEDYLAICTGEKFSESWKLLELSIVKGKGIFFISNDIQGMQRNITQSMIDDYVEATKEILLAFISQIQTLSPTPTCLKEKIPELDSFFTEIKYLQEDVDMQVIFKGKDHKIFEKLKNYPLAFEKCRALLKKKAKSESKAAPKKS
jgi:hypothetical protein